MKTLNTKLGLLALLAGGILTFAGVHAQDSPHWNKSTCQTCHLDADPIAGKVDLQAPDPESLCDSCHGDRGDALPCRHASDIPVGSINVPDSLSVALKDGSVVCTTCHDIVYQCERPRIHFSLQNPGFLRDRTSHKGGDYCLKCHDSAEYQKLNPHQGVTGTPPRPTCLLCHAGFPETGATGELVVKFNMQQDFNDTCLGCHDVQPHPRPLIMFSAQETTEWVHLVAPSAEVLAKMQQTEKVKGVTLPLNPETGEVFCATCHNQHGFKSGEQQTKHRLRTDDICQACHER